MSEQKRLAVKYCGLTQLEDVAAAVDCGVDAIGLVFYDKSARAVSVAQAADLAAAIPAFVSVVALVVNISDEQLCQIAEQVAVDIIQFHGDETPSECARQAKLVNKRWIKALRIDSAQMSAAQVCARIDEFAEAGAASILLDAYTAVAYGGTGERFDWSLIPQTSSLPVILAGGLTVQNVAQTKNLPIYGVDVSGGIERAKGVKDADKMRDFMRRLRD